MVWAVGDRVSALYDGTNWYSAVIAEVHSDGAEYTLDWEDGDTLNRRQPAVNVAAREGEGEAPQQQITTASQSDLPAAAPARVPAEATQQPKPERLFPTSAAKRISLTGNYEDRKDILDRCRAALVSVEGIVHKKLDGVVATAESIRLQTQRVRKARKFGIPLLTEQDLETLLESLRPGPPDPPPSAEAAGSRLEAPATVHAPAESSSSSSTQAQPPTRAATRSCWPWLPPAGPLGIARPYIARRRRRSWRHHVYLWWVSARSPLHHLLEAVRPQRPVVTIP